MREDGVRTPDQQAAEAALARKGLTVLGEQDGTLVVCRGLDSRQTNAGYLDVSVCQMQECCILEGEQSLQQLDLSSNRLQSFQPQHAAPITALTALTGSHNRLTDVSGLSLLIQLRVLDIGRNRLTQIQQITDLQQLQVFNFHHNAVSDLSPLQRLPQLQVVNAAANRVHHMPSLTSLTQLTELNLRSNAISSLTCSTTGVISPPQAAAAAGAVFPSSLRRLSLARNQLQSLSALQPLRALPCLEDLCIDGNPIADVLYDQQVTAPGVVGSNGYRQAVLSCCPPTLLMLDLQPVSPSERVGLLTAAVKLKAAQRTVNMLGGAALSQADGHATEHSAAAVGQAMQLQSRRIPRLTAAVQQQQGHMDKAHNQSSCPQRQQQQQQHEGDDDADHDDFVFSPTAAATAARGDQVNNSWSGSTAALAMPAAADKSTQQYAPDCALSQLTPRLGQDAYLIPAAAAAAATAQGSSSAAGDGSSNSQSAQLSLVDKLRPHSGPAAIGRLSSNPAAAAAMQGGSSDGTSSAAIGCLQRSSSSSRYPHCQMTSSGTAAMSLEPAAAAAAVTKLRIASAPPGSLAAYAAFATHYGAGAADDDGEADGDVKLAQWAPGAGSRDGSSSSKVHQDLYSGPINLHDKQAEHQQQQQHEVNVYSAAAGDQQISDSIGSIPIPVPTHHLAGCPDQQEFSVVNQAGSATGPHSVNPPAAGTTAPTTLRPYLQQQQQPTQYRGLLKLAAVACGVSVWNSEGVDSTDAGNGVQQYYGAAAGCGSAAVDSCGDDLPAGMSNDHEELQAEKIILTDRQSLRSPRRPVSVPGSIQLAGVECSGSRVVLTGDVLHALRGGALEHTSDLTIQHVDYSKVLSVLPVMSSMRRLHTLTLRSTSGLSLLPHLHPLLQLTGLKHLTIDDCQICSLTLLQPYVAFRFSNLLAFNGVTVTRTAVCQSAELFGVLEATLAAALAQAPQQAALAASGVLKARKNTKQGTYPIIGTAAVGATTATSVWQPLAGIAQMEGEQQGQQQTGANKIGSNVDQVTQVFAAMGGPLMPAAKHQQQAAEFAQQFVMEAAAVQQQLHRFHETDWPALVERSTNEGWTGHYESAR